MATCWNEVRPGILNQRKAVFVVDDDPSMLKGVRRLLKQHGFETVPFETAKALQDHEDFAQAFCLVLDVNLGDGSGIELRHQLAEAGVSLPVIYITGNDSDATRMAAMASGCVAYLTKPFPAQSLIEPIKRAAATYG
jgi:FixJ family two-component response regulator